MSINAEKRDRAPGRSRSTSQFPDAQAALGVTLDELVTPALVLERAALERNVAKMAALVDGTTRLRPHAKTHKSPKVAALQVTHGAIGITTATVWEALSLAEAGIDDLLVANEVVGAAKVEALARAATRARVTVAVDSASNAEELSTAARAERADIGVLVDVDVGLGRCGVRSPTEAAELADRIAAVPGLTVRGVMGFEGHCTFEPDSERRRLLAEEAMARLLDAAEAIAARGHQIDVVSAGGTGTFDSTGAHPGVTELQAGSYAFMDSSHAAIVPGFEFALRVLATVISQHGSTIVLDAGKKTLGLDAPAPLLLSHTSRLRYVAEEHTVLDLQDCALTVGDRVELVPSYCPVTVNLHEAYFVLEDGVVADVWPIEARGSGWAVREPGNSGALRQ
jgi:D-serine deaminase-like pyridoxal phosphate-dependent protein